MKGCILRRMGKQTTSNHLVLTRVILKKWGSLCLMVFVVGLCSSCAITIPRSIPGSRFVLQSEINRFEQTQGLSCSEIPEIYDMSRLKVGSTVKIKSIYDKSKKPFFETMILRDIQSTKIEKQYIIDLVIGKDIYTIEGESSAFNRVVCSDKINMRNYTRTGGDNIPSAIIKGALIAGPIGIALSLYDYSLMQEIDKEAAQSLREQEIETKIVDFKLISHERLTIANQSISCKVYQIQTITRQTRPSMKKLPGATLIIDESIKLWISDDVPFGEVKREGSKTLHAGFVGRGISKGEFDFSQDMTENCEVIEFTY